MTLSLATAPNLEQLKKQSKDLLRSFRAKNPSSIDRVLQYHPEFERVEPDAAARRIIQLADSQLVLAREYGFPSWPRLKQEVERRMREAGREPLARPFKLRKENGKVWLEDVPTLGWGTDRECTFAGGLASATAITEHPVSYTDIMGFSGLAFRTRWFQNTESPDCCPSSPVGEFPEEIAAVSRATGWQIWTGNRLGDSDKSMAPYWAEIVSSIDEGRPVLTYTPGVMDIAVAYGYAEGERVLIHEYGESQVERAVSDLGPLIAFLDENVGPLPLADTFAVSLETAIANFHRESSAATGGSTLYRYGSAALKAWASDIAAVRQDQGSYYDKLFFVSWWCLDSLFDARTAASAYLKEHAGLLGEPLEPLIQQAANLYADEAALLSRAFARRDVFFGPWSGKSIGDWIPSVRDLEQALLLEALAIEEKSIDLLDRALKAAREQRGA